MIAVDWGGGSAVMYSQAAANTRLVGLEVAFLIENLIVRKLKACPSNEIKFYYIFHLNRLITRRISKTFIWSVILWARTFLDMLENVWNNVAKDCWVEFRGLIQQNPCSNPCQSSWDWIQMTQNSWMSFTLMPKVFSCSVRMFLHMFHCRRCPSSFLLSTLAKLD